MPYIPPVKVVATTAYDRRARKLLTAEERATAELGIALAPDAWPVIPGTGGARKARAARGGTGKRGGARIVYFLWVARTTVYMLDIYAKGAKENLTDDDKKEIRRTIEALRSEA